MIQVKYVFNISNKGYEKNILLMRKKDLMYYEIEKINDKNT